MVKRDATITERQAAWFKSVEEGLARETGRSIEAWAEIARTCPETTARARQRWLKETYGIGQNRAALIFERAFPGEGVWDDPEGVLATLWAQPAQKAIFDAVSAVVGHFDGVTVGPRKGYVAFSRTFQFAAIKPYRKAAARLGLAAPVEICARLDPPNKSESWSERLKAVLMLEAPEEVDDEVAHLLHLAWTQS